MTARTQRSLRNVHNWLGLFFAPGILFFSFTGALQTLGLHEAEAHPPAWLAAAASLHQHQVTSHAHHHHPDESPAVATRAPAHEEHGDDDAPLSGLKIYVLLLSALLIVSTLLGVAIAWTNRMARRRTALLLAAGTLVPALLLLA